MAVNFLSKWFGGKLKAQAGWIDTAYAGASRIRKQLANWLPTRSAADADLLPNQDMLVARSRDLDRNNGVAAGGFQTLSDNVVGVGLRMSCRPDWRALGRDIQWAEEWGRSTESLWRTWADSTACDVSAQMNFPALTQLVFRSALQNGEALALPLWMERSDTPWRTCLQMIDTDRLSNPGYALPTVALRGGVEMDAYGRPVAYYIRKIDTTWGVLWSGLVGIGSVAGLSYGITGNWERIPAETAFGRKRVLHVLQRERVDQTRGKPILAPIIEQFRMLDSYQRTELQSAIVNSIVAGIIETPLDPAGITELMGGDPNAYLQNKCDYRIQLEGGTLIPLYPGDKLTPFVPSRPAPQFSNFVEAIYRQIGTCLGLPYELIIKDFSKTNYSSARAALLEAWRFFIGRRAWLATNWCQPVYNLWLEEAVNAGLVEAPGYYENRQYYQRARWIGPGRGWIDPVKEAQAAQLRMDIYISTLEDECAEQGLDWDEVLEQRAMEQSRMRELGLAEAPFSPAPPRGEKPQPDVAEEGVPAQQGVA